MSIDINCDLGEGVGNDALIMPLIGSCNIACGGHTGDTESIVKTLVLAKENNVKIGAHPSFPDRENFGRKTLTISLNELYESIYNQINKIIIESQKLNLKIHHIKPHGALYNEAAKNRELSEVIVKVLKKLGLNVKVYAPYNSVLAKVAQNENIAVCYEAFLDRRYNKEGSLVSRTHKEALITSKEDIFKQFYGIYKHQKLTCLTGEEINIKAQTFCIHGDNKKAVSILNYLHKKCKENNININ